MQRRMAQDSRIKHLSWQYARQEISIAVALCLLALLLMRILYLNEILVPAVVSTVFVLLVGLSIAVIWRRVAEKAPESLPTFFTAVSGFRMLLGIATMFVYYLVADKKGMLAFFIVFFVFYLASLIHHTVFFAKVSNSSERIG